MDYPIKKHPEFCYKTEFQSHEPEFDYLKSLKIVEKIKWCQTVNDSMFLLSTNDKTIKFWKIKMAHNQLSRELRLFALCLLLGIYSGLAWWYLLSKPIAAIKVTLNMAVKAFATSLPLCKATFFSAGMDEYLVQRINYC